MFSVPSVDLQRYKVERTEYWRLFSSPMSVQVRQTNQTRVVSKRRRIHPGFTFPHPLQGKEHHGLNKHSRQFIFFFKVRRQQSLTIAAIIRT